MDLGVLGGTFNPVHLGHLRAAEEVGEALGLERVAFVPAKSPPHKGGEAMAPPEVRLAMVRAAVDGNPRFRVLDLELRRSGPSYSFDTLTALRRELAPEDRLWFLVGADAFREIHTWHRYEELFALADFAVMRRPPGGAPLGPPAAVADRFELRGTGFRHVSGREVRVVPVTLLDVSSTRIRRALAAGASVRYLVPEAVRRLLEEACAEHPEWFTGSDE